MEIILVTGPGGAGSSTVAAATAVELSASGARSVLMTTQEPRPAGVDRAVQVHRVAAQPAAERLWERCAGELAAALPVAVPPASSVVAVPAVTEFAVLAALAEHASGGRTDVVVLDAGARAGALALLALPGALRWWLAQAAPPRLRVLATLRSAVVPGRPGGVAALLGGVAALEDLLGRTALTDPARTAVHLVLRPEAGAAEELCGAATALGVYGQRVASVTVNRLLPTLPGGWGMQRDQLQRTAVERVAALAGPVRQLAEAAVPPADVPALQALGAAVPRGTGAPLPPPQPRRVPGGWLLALALPFARRGEVELTRWADDLVVTAAGQRRSLPLDPLLRRCTVAGGTLTRPETAHAALEVRFTPDPAQWPAGLLEAEESRA